MTKCVEITENDLKNLNLTDEQKKTIKNIIEKADEQLKDDKKEEKSSKMKSLYEVLIELILKDKKFKDVLDSATLCYISIGQDNPNKPATELATYTTERLLNIINKKGE